MSTLEIVLLIVGVYFQVMEDRVMGKEQNQKKETKKKPAKTMKEKKAAKLEKKKNR